MKRQWLLLALAGLWATACAAADRAITVAPVYAGSWEYLTNVAQVKPRQGLGVGYWQRGSGAKPGVGSNFVATLEFQLPESAPARVRSATFQFSGRQSQCSGNEPVVIDVYAYAGDGRGEIGDSTAGTRVAQMSANCSDNPAFTRPIDVTQIVRQLSVPAGIRHVGFNMRKANNRQGPGIFNLAVPKLTIVLADQEIARGARPGAPVALAAPAPLPTQGVAGVQPTPGGDPQAAARPSGLLKAFVHRQTGGAVDSQAKAATR